MRKFLQSGITAGLLFWLSFGTAFAQESPARDAQADLEPAVSAEEDAAEAIPKDVVLVLDNSGSMKQNDPEFLASQAVREFIGDLDQATRLAIIVFDQDVTLAMPLTAVTPATRGRVLESLEQIDYQGLFTDSPNAVERAIYELKNKGREEARKLIIFMTDGIVDTGDAANDQELSRWLRDSLGPDAADAGIQIFAIAFTEAADFSLIQSLAQTTGGEYYRALQAEDLQRVFEQINGIINRIDELPEEPPEPEVSQPPPQPPMVIQVPSQPSPGTAREERIRSVIMITAAVVLIVTLLAILVVLIRRRHSGPEIAEVETEAYLNDIHGYTSRSSYKLGARPTMLGRVAGKDTDHLDYIVIPESTIGRRHSLIEYKDYSYWIVDQGSINGTFVNDKPVTTEERLKHGDRIRLHKFEFEFVMPEMVDAGMTVMSNTVMANNPSAPAAAASHTVEESTVLKSGRSNDVTETEEAPDFELDPDLDLDVKTGAEGMDLDIDLTAGMEPDTGQEGAEPTAMPDQAPDDEIGSEDETFVPDGNITPDNGQSGKTAKPADPGEDETLMPGEFGFPEEDDATLRKDEDGDEDEDPLDNFIDLDLDDDEDTNRKG